MRIRKLMAVPIAALMLTGCILEDRSHCNNVTFVFSYDSKRGVEFTSRIDQVDLFLFDANGNFLLTSGAATADLEPGYPAMTFSLSPGTYYALAWGNMAANSAFKNIARGTPLEECIAEIEREQNRSGDPVYYAPRKPLLPLETTRVWEEDEDIATLYKVVVPEEGKVVKPLDFVRAHRTIHVWIKGLSDPEGLMPTVEAQKLWSSYDFSYRTLDDRRDYVQLAHESTMEGETYALAVFHHAYGELDNDMRVAVYITSDNYMVCTIPIKKFVEDHYPTDPNPDDIHIMIEFGYDLGATITIPGWLVRHVQPS